MEAKQAKWFEAHFGCTLTPVTDQKCGCARDYKIVGLDENTELPGELNSFVEFKFDYKASQTGNLYLEYEQTFDFGKKYLSSGMKLAVDQSRFIVFSVGYSDCVHHYIFTNIDMYDILTQKLRTIRTRNGANGNRPGCWTNGLLLPLKDVELFKQIERTSVQTTP